MSIPGFVFTNTFYKEILYLIDNQTYNGNKAEEVIRHLFPNKMFMIYKDQP